VRAEEFEGWGAEKWVPRDFDPVSRISASARKAGQVEFHPTARNVLAAATGDHVVKLYDLALPDDALSTLSGHTDAIQSIAFSFNGQQLVTTCRDRKVRLFDARKGGEPVRIGDGHAGIKGARVVWMGESDRIASTGFSKMSERQVSIWDTSSLKIVKTVGIDQSAGVIMPFYSDNNILFLGECSVRCVGVATDNFDAS
jgi:coronin-1B/1C/6